MGGEDAGRGSEGGGAVTIHIPEWLLWLVGTVAALYVFAGLIAFRSLRGPFWR